MNSEYVFNLNEYNDLICTVNNLHGTHYYYNQKALNKLQMLDAYDYNSTRLSRNSVTLLNDRISLKIDGYNGFYKNGLMGYLPRNKEVITEAIRRYKQAQHQKKKLQQLKKTINKAIVSASVLALLGIGLTQLNAMPKEKAEELPIEPPAITQGIEESSKENEIIIDEQEYQVEMPSEQILTEPTQEELQMNHEEFALVQNSPAPTEVEEENIAYLDFEHNRDSEKGDHAYDNYYELVEKYANKWGISPNLIMSMLTQESGGYHKNLMQIQFWSWEDQVINVYNFEADKWERLVLTENSSYYKNKYNGDIITINKQDLQNPITNISVGSVLLRESARMMDNHICASIQCYNFGYSNMMKVLRETANQNGVEVSDLLADQENIDFTRNTNIISAGDPNYLSNVLQYTNDLQEGFVLKEIDENGNIIENTIRVLPASTLSH